MEENHKDCREWCSHKSYNGYANTMKPDDDRHEVWQEQYNERGFDDSVTWSLDYQLIGWFIPRLERFIEITSDVNLDDDNYTAMAREMLEGFKFAQSPEYNEFNQEHNDKVKRSFELLAENYRGLWW
jgi:hypothetical protein